MSTGNSQKNLLSSATDAVISIVKRAAEALGNKVDNQTSGVKVNDSISVKNVCNSPRHVVVCSNCNETLFAQIYDLLSCKSSYIQKLVSIPAISKALINSFTCQSFGFAFKTNFSGSSSYINNLHRFFPKNYVGAMCNEIALIQNQGSLNITHQYLNVTKKLTKEKIISLDVTSSELSLGTMNKTLPAPHTNSDSNTINVHVSGAVENSLVDQIKPTRALNSDPELAQTVNGSISPDEPPVVHVEPNSTEESNIPIDNGLIDNFSTSTVSSEILMVTESSEILEDHIDNIISSDATVDSSGLVMASSTTANLPQAPKESIFIRLSNRIKVSKNFNLFVVYSVFSLKIWVLTILSIKIDQNITNFVLFFAYLDTVLIRFFFTTKMILINFLISNIF